MPDSSVTFESGGRQLVGFLQEPDSCGRPKGTWLFCHPLFEERKSAQRVLVETGRALTHEGWVVLHFDYRGCGDSEGDFETFSIPDWRADIQTASTWLEARFPDLPRGILGLRLGAALAWAEATIAPLAFRRMVLWAPVVNGREYLENELRRKVMKEMLTFGSGRSSRDQMVQQLGQGHAVDFDGYRVTPDLYRDLCELSVQPPYPHVPEQGLIIGLTSHGRPDTHLIRWAESWKQAGGCCTLRFLAEPPFWSLIGLVPCEKLIRTTCEWIGGRPI